ncbi:MAG: hypothetical protein ACE5IK_04805 [Acidobacteriota bacterium]
MRFRTHIGRASWVAVMAFCLVGGALIASPQQKKDSEPAEGKKSTPAAEKQAPPAGEPSRPDATPTGNADGAKAPKPGKATKKDGEQATPPADEPYLNTAATAAGILRSKGEVISQKGDLKIAVDNNFFTEFPGFDLSHLSENQHEALVKKANSVYCTCGCRGDTVARCVTLDASCQVARKMLQKMLDDVAASTPSAPAPPKSD